MQGSAAFMVSAVKAPEVSSIGGEWAVLGLARSGYSVPKDYFDNYFDFKNSLEELLGREIDLLEEQAI